jgi:hypothetical protein
MIPTITNWLKRTAPLPVAAEDDPTRGKWGRSYSSGETSREVETRLAMEDRCAALGKKLGAGMKLALLMFDFGEAGNLAYYTNMDTAEVREGIAGWLTSQR